MNETLDGISAMLGKLYGLPGYMLVCVACFIAGYLLKKSAWFQNQGIPWVVVLLGGVLNPMIADPTSDTTPFRIWLIKNAVIGLACGLLTWLGHNQIVKRFESDEPEPPKPV